MNRMAATWRGRLVLGATAVVLLVGCGAAGGASTASSPSVGPSAVLTDADAGRTVTLAVGQEAVLRLSGQRLWTDPQAGGGVVRLTPRAFVRNPGYREWVITPLGRGTATITASGRPLCSPGQICPALVMAYTITVVVT
jgi:hypothetical protein